MSDAAPASAAGRRPPRPVHDEAMPLIVVGSSPVLGEFSGSIGELKKASPTLFSDFDSV